MMRMARCYRKINVIVVLDQSLPGLPVSSISSSAAGCPQIREGTGVDTLVGIVSGATSAESESSLGALSVLRNMAARSTSARDAVREANGIPPLVKLLNEGADKQCTMLAAATLRNLARNHDVNRKAIRDAGLLRRWCGYSKLGKTRRALCPTLGATRLSAAPHFH